MDYSVLIVAAGRGERMGLGYNKVFYLLKEGTTILDTTMEIFLKDDRCRQIVIVTNQNEMTMAMKKREVGRIVHVAGGETRQASVRNGLMAVTQDVVLIHDGARPWCPTRCVDDLLVAMETEDAAVLAVAVKDTIKEVEEGYIVRTIERSRLAQAQTPQAFKTKLIMEACKIAEDTNAKVTDDAQMVEMFTKTRVKIIEGSYSNIKITTKEDLKRN
ncbi:MAG TPA: 2-C-methyl-D-erythritol 4-phosphate cytidylyltransferase [Erysipelotrichaceae bacterium]|nr:2-C-methyl-D-erythritol 4-phosphate cytidylyltransferase [Erysipelotrichaceae bacterium]